MEPHIANRMLNGGIEVDNRVIKEIAFTHTEGAPELVEIPFSIDSSVGYPIDNIVVFDIQLMDQERENVDSCYELGEQSFDCPFITILNTSGQPVHRLVGYDGNITLDNGEYILQIVNESAGFGTPLDARVRLYGYENPPSESSIDAVAGGIRVAEIISRDIDDTVVSKRKFEYQLFSQPSRSSGKALNPPVYLIEGLQVCQTAPGGNSVQLFSDPIFSLANESNYSVGYTNVTEYYQGKQNGKTEYTFSFAAKGYGIQSSKYICGFSFDFPKPCETYPNTPIHDLSHRRGLLLQKEEFETHNGTLRPVHKTLNVYDFDDSGDESSRNLSLGTLPRMYSEYTNLGEELFYKKQRNTSYFYTATQVDSIATEKEYFYNSYPTHAQVTKTRFVDSQGNTTTTLMDYPDDVATTASLGAALTNQEFAAIQRLQKNGAEPRIGQPIHHYPTY